MQNNRPTYVHGYRHRLHSVIGCASGLPHTLAGSGDGRDMNSSLSLRCLATFPGLILPLLHLTFDTMQPLLQLVIGSSIVMEPCD
jgi:hypothetical protein